MAFKKLAVLGVGAIGGNIGAYLTRANWDITLIDLWPAHVEAMMHHGLKVISPDEEFTVKVRAVHLADVSSLREHFDVVFLTVKSYDSLWAAKFIEPHLTPAGVLVSAQNGINEDVLAPAIGYTRVIGCVVTIGAGVYEPGHVTRTSAHSLHAFTLGELTGMITPRVQELANVLTPVGPASTTPNLWGERWSKLTVNCMGNAIGGITGMGSAEVRAHPDAFPLLLTIAAEALTVAQALGVQVEPVIGVPAPAILAAARGKDQEALRRALMGSRRDVGAGRPSLLQDVLKGRRTEVDYLNGYVVRKGREVGVPTPMNQAIVQVTTRVEEGELKQGPSNLDLLTKHL